VSAHDDHGALALAPALTDARGEFRLVGVPAGAWDVRAEAHAGALRGEAHAATPDAALEIALTVRP
jgi:hypothetical protein